MTDKLAYSYMRFSSQHQIKGSSLDRQEERLDDFLAANPSYILQEEVFFDEAMTGFTGKHRDVGKLGKFLALCEEGKVKKNSYLLVESVDRLARINTRDFFELILKLFDYVTIVTLEDNEFYDNESLGGHAVHSLVSKMQQAHNYSKQLSERLIKGRIKTRNKVVSGEKNKITKTCPSWLEWSTELSKFIVIEDRMQIVQGIFNYYLDGLGTTAIASKLNKEGVPSFGGKGWYGSYIFKILFNRKVLGEMTSKNMITLIDYYPSIISIDIFLAAGARKKQKLTKTYNHENPQPTDIYKGVVFCICGTEAKLYNKGNNKYLYRCKDKVLGKCNASDGLNKDILVTHIGAYLDYKLITKVREDSAQFTLHNSESTKQPLDELENTKAKAQTKLSRYKEMYVGIDDEVERIDMLNTINTLRDDIRLITHKIQEVKEGNTTIKLTSCFEMADIGTHSVDWHSFIRGDNRRLLPSSQAISLNQWLIKTDVKIVLEKGYKATLRDTNNALVFSVKKIYRCSNGSVSHLSDGKKFIDISAEGYREHGEGFKRAELLGEDNKTPIDIPHYIT
jgi:DNA invertase Pin-like site-specific DNA recombinase